MGNDLKKDNLISIIVPIYKVEKYLQRCIDSLISQTYKNIEIILVDDGSPDSCGSICDKNAIKDKRIRVIHKSNGGLSSARNAGLDVCSGDYIMFVDSDDWVEPDFCKDAYASITSYGVDLSVFGYYEFRNDKKIVFCTPKPRIADSEEALKLILQMDDVVYNFAWNKIYHKRLFNKLRYPEGRLYEDQGTTYKAISSAKKIYISNSILYNYDRRHESITSASNTPKDINDKFDLWYERLIFLKKYHPSLVEEEYRQLSNHILNGIKFIDFKKDAELKNKMTSFLKQNKEAILALNLQHKSLYAFYYLRPLFYIIVYIKKKWR